MTAVVGPNLGITAGHAPGDDGWGADMNLNLRMTDGLPWFTTAVAPTNTPPGSPALGDRYIVGTAPTGAWATHGNALAIYQKDETDTSAWRFYAPKAGWEALVLDASGSVAPVRYLYRGGAWAVEPAVSWNAGTVTALGGGLGLSGGTLAAAVVSVAGHTGAVTLAAADVTGAEATANKGVSGGYASLDGSAKVPLAQLPASVVGGLSYQGTWNASTNSPTLASGTGTLGNYYVVSTAGTTTIDGVSAWGVGDWISFDGTKWDKLDGQANPVSSVAGRQGAVTLTSADIGGLNGIASQTAPAAGLVYSNGSILQPVTVGANITFSGGTISATGGGASIWNAGTVTALGPNLSDTGGTLTLVVPTSDPGVAGELWVTSSGQVAVSGTPPELPLGFIIPGKPTAGQPYNLPIAAACLVNANFAGTVVYDGTQTTANAVFTVNKIHAGTTTTIGTLTITSASHTSVTLSTQAAVALAVGDVLQVVAPSSQDATLADVGITILTTKV